MVCWLEIRGKISTALLSPNTIYGAYLVIQLANRAFGLDTRPIEVEVELGGYKTVRTIYININTWKNCRKLETSGEEEVLVARCDGWLEIDLGEFYTDEHENEVKMAFREVEGEHLKGGLIVEGIEIRPKVC